MENIQQVATRLTDDMRIMKDRWMLAEVATKPVYSIVCNANTPFLHTLND